MPSLLAILLVTNSTNGHHFVFSYPANPRRSPQKKPNCSTKTASVRLPPNASSQAQVTEDNPDRNAGRDTVFNMWAPFLADTLSPELPLCDKRFQLTVDDLTFVGHPVSLPAQQQQNAKSSPQKQQQKQKNDKTSSSSSSAPVLAADAAEHMTLFHVVFVLSPPDLLLTAEVDALYTHVVRRYAAGLRYEQFRCGYVQDQVQMILALRENTTDQPYDDVVQTILQDSSLARDIKHIYTALSTDAVAHVIINDFIDLSLQIPAISAPNSASSSGYDAALPLARTQDYYYASLVDIYGDGYEYDSYPTICPYHTLLLLEDPEEVLKNMPLDASPTLVQLVQILTPTQSLQELHLLLDCSLAQVYRLAAHLIYWRKAKLIHTIHARNIYVVSPEAKLVDLSALNADFRVHIPNLDLPTLLSQLSIAKPLHMIAPKDLRNQYLEAITYLVRKDLVLQLHMFLVLMSDGHPRNNSFSSSPSSSTAGGQNGGAESPAAVTKRPPHEKVPKEIAELFER